MAPESEEERPAFEEEGGPVKTFLEHLEDLRWTLIKVIASLGIGMVVCMAAANKIVAFLTWPLTNSGTPVKLQFLSPLGPFNVTMKIALYGGISLALPFILYFIAEFVMPALKAHEKNFFRRAFMIGTGLFIGGMILCYFLVLPITIRATVQFTAWLGGDIIPTDFWRAEDFFQFVILFMVGMGVSFELPIVVLALVKVGILPHAWLVKGRRYFLVANLVVCSFITPDFVSTIFLVLPVQVLLEICIWISWYWERKKKRALEQTALPVQEPRGGSTVT
jgi:sec-independent protein translocase protein TatC